MIEDRQAAILFLLKERDDLAFRVVRTLNDSARRVLVTSFTSAPA